MQAPFVRLARALRVYHGIELHMLRRCPIFVVRNILVPTDFSECSAAAFEHAATFAIMYNAHLHVLHVAKELPVSSLGTDADGAADATDSGGGPLGDRLEKFVARWLPQHAKLFYRIRFGQPHKEILEYTEHEAIDLIVIATHGRTGLNHLMMGSVAEKVMRLSPVPVLTVKPQKLRLVLDDDYKSETMISELGTHEPDR